MNLDTCKKIAVELTAALGTLAPSALVLSSSCAGVDTMEAGKQLAEAFSAQRIKAAVLDCRDESPAGVEAALKALLPEVSVSLDTAAPVLPAAGVNTVVDLLYRHFAVTILVTRCLRQSNTAMLLAAASQNVLLLEQKKLSRTDEIDETVEIIRNLQAKPLGFVLQ